jgi:uncharacterized membrane protein
MMIEKLIKKMVPGTTTVTENCCFLGFCFFYFFTFFVVVVLVWFGFFVVLMECARCLYNFVQMTAEPGKAVAAIDA